MRLLQWTLPPDGLFLWDRKAWRCGDREGSIEDRVSGCSVEDEKDE